MADWLGREFSNNGISERVKVFRKKRGWTQEEMAERAGCSSCAVSRIESGKISSSSRVARLCEKAIREEELLDGEIFQDWENVLLHMLDFDDDWVRNFFGTLIEEREKCKEIKVLRIVWDAVVLYHEKNDSFWESSNREEVGKLLSKVCRLKESYVSSEGIDDCDIWIKNLYGLLLFAMGSKKAAVRIMEQLLAEVLLNYKEERHKNIVVASLYNNLSYMKIKMRDYEEARILIAKSWDYVSRLGTGMIVAVLFKNFSEICIHLENKEGRRKAQVAVETISDLMGMKCGIRSLNGEMIIDSVVFVF